MLHKIQLFPFHMAAMHDVSKLYTSVYLDPVIFVLRYFSMSGDGGGGGGRQKGCFQLY